MKASPHATLSALILVVFISGCSAPSPSQERLTVVRGSADLPRLEALAVGVQVLQLDGCLGIHAPDGGIPDAVLVVPADAEITESGARLASGLVLEPGATVDLAGGLVEEPLEGIFELPGECAANPAWAVHDAR